MNEAPRPWITVNQALETIRINNRGRTGGHFVILGAGIAGLAAAYELIQLGHRATVIEGSHRPGGRIWTERFSDGTYCERGAMRIPTSHDYTNHYVRVAKLDDQLRKFWNSTPQGFYCIQGKVARTNQQDFIRNILPLFHKDGGPRLTPEEYRIASNPTGDGPGDLLGYYMKPITDEFIRDFLLLKALVNWDLSDGRFREKLVRLDNTSWRRCLESKASTAGLNLVGECLSLKAVWEWSIAAVLRDEFTQPSKGLCEIIDGLDRLPHNLAGILPAGTIRYNTEVMGITIRGTSGGDVSLLDRGSGKRETLPFQRMLVTLPYTVMRRLKNRDGLQGFSPGKLSAIDGLGSDYTSSTKALFSYDQRWWETRYDIRGGRSVSSQTVGSQPTALVPRQTYYPSDSRPAPCEEPALLATEAKGAEDTGWLFSQYTGEDVQAEAELLQAPAAEIAGPGAMLASYMLNQGSKALRAMTPPDRMRTVLTGIRCFHRDAPDPPRSLIWCWDQNYWSAEDPTRKDPEAPGGAFAITHPGTLANFFDEARKPEGRAFFAGEHLSITPGWIQGALESSLREVAKMVIP
jgi:monoamine oxidase